MTAYLCDAKENVCKKCERNIVLLLFFGQFVCVVELIVESKME